MRIILDSELSTYTLIPVESEEEQILVSIAAILETKDVMLYYGGDQNEDGSYAVNFRAYGKLGAHVDLVLSGSTEKDKHEVNGVYAICDSGLNRLFFLGETKVDDKKAIVISYKY